MFDCRVYVRPLCSPLDIAVSRSAAIIVWPSFSSIYPARRGMRHTYLLNYVCIRVGIHIRQSSKPLRTRAVSSSNFCDASSLRFPRLVFILPRARSGYVPWHEKGFPSIHANFNLFGYASRPLPRWWRKSAFDDDDDEINETIDLRMTFKRLHRHRSSLDLLGCSLVGSFSN